jgi:Tol biopolymer transport system component
VLTELSLPDSIDPLMTAGVTVALSPDGSNLAFLARSPSGSQAIYVRPMHGLDARLVPGTEGAISPSFSADGSWLLFSVQGALRKVPITGGTALLVADRSHVAPNTSWNERDEIIFGSEGELWLGSGRGGTPTPLTTVDSARGHLRYSWPYFLPGNKEALITLWKQSANLDDAELGVVRLRDGRVTELGERGFSPRLIAGDIIVFARADGTIFAAPFSLRRLRLSGTSIPVLQDVFVKGGGASELTVSRTGTLVFRSSGSGKRELVRVNRNGAASSLVTLDQIESPRIGPGGRRIALATISQRDVWTYDLVTGGRMRLTNDEISDHPEWSPDGQRIAFRNRGRNDRIMWKPWDGAGQAAVLYETPGVWTSDIDFGRQFNAVTRNSSAGLHHDIWIVPADSPRAARPFLDSPAQEFSPRISPDGNVLAYVSDEAGSREVYVKPLPGPGPRIRVSNAGGEEPVWSPLGDELFYRTPDSFMSATIVQSPELDVARRAVLFPDEFLKGGGIQRANYDVFPNGNEFVFVRSPLRFRIVTITNWTEEVRRKLDAAR